MCSEGSPRRGAPPAMPRPWAAAGIQEAQAPLGSAHLPLPSRSPFSSLRCPLPLASPSESGLLARSCAQCVGPAGPPAALAAALCPRGDRSLTPLRRPSPSAAHAACTSVLVHVALHTRGCYGRILRSRDAAWERTCVLNLEGDCQIAFLGSRVSAPAKSRCACCSVLGGGGGHQPAWERRARRWGPAALQPRRGGHGRARHLPWLAGVTAPHPPPLVSSF